jgi:chromosomal replication initiation ATPase DnaA
MERQLLPLVDKIDYSPEKWVQAPCNAIVTRWLFALASGEGARQNQIKGPIKGQGKGQGKGQITCVCGPKESGKTHVANIFKSITNAVELAPADCATSPYAVFAAHKNKRPPSPQSEKGSSFVLDNIEFFQEQWLFGMFNLLVSQSATALFTIGAFAPQWQFRLKDLESRLKSTNIINISPPDDALIKNIIMKQCQDNGVYIDASTTDYLMERIPRGFEDINYWLRKLNRYSLIFGAKISKNLINQALADDEEKLLS